MKRLIFLVFVALAGLVILKKLIPKSYPPILLIIVDTLRADHMSIYDYDRKTTPHIDRWFGEGAVFTRAYSTSANTPMSVTSILTGLLPQDHTIRLFYQKIPPTLKILPDYLPKEYQTAAFVSNNVLTNEAMGWADRFDHYDDFVVEKEPYRKRYERTAEKTTNAALHWVKTQRDPKKPLFLIVHYIDPHGPYQPPGNWRKSFSHKGFKKLDINRVSPYMRLAGVKDGLTYIDQYDEEIAYADSHINRLLEEYRKHYKEDESLIILTSDHGESMMDHELWFTHEYHVYEELTRVPLLIIGEGIKSGRIDKLVSIQDIFNTVLEATHTNPPDFPYNRNLLSWKRIPNDRVVYAEGGNDKLQVRSMVGQQYKWLVTIPRGQFGIHSQWRYDLNKDPKELKSLPWEPQNELTDSFIKLCQSDQDPGGYPKRIIKGKELTQPKVPPNLSPEALENLRALGYLN